MPATQFGHSVGRIRQLTAGAYLTKLGYSLAGHVTLMTFSRSWIQRSRSQTTFFENVYFPGVGIP